MLRVTGCYLNRSNSKVNLLPLDVDLESESLIKATSYSVTDLTRLLDGVRNKINVVVLDACRVPPAVGGGARSLGDTSGSMGSENIYYSLNPAGEVTAGSITINSDIAGEILFDGRATGIAVKEGGIATIPNVGAGLRGLSIQW